MLYRVICPDCRLELHWDDEKLAEWKAGPQKCPQCGAALRDMHVDEVRIDAEDRRPKTDTDWLDFLEVLGRTPPDLDGDWNVCFSKDHGSLREALAVTWASSAEARSAYIAWRRSPVKLVVPAADEVVFHTMSHHFQVFERMSDAELREMLQKAGWPEPANKVAAVMDNMRREYGEAAVTDWLAECGRRGIIT